MLDSSGASPGQGRVGLLSDSVRLRGARGPARPPKLRLPLEASLRSPSYPPRTETDTEGWAQPAGIVAGKKAYLHQFLTPNEITLYHAVNSHGDLIRRLLARKRPLKNKGPFKEAYGEAGRRSGVTGVKRGVVGGGLVHSSSGGGVGRDGVSSES